MVPTECNRVRHPLDCLNQRHYALNAEPAVAFSHFKLFWDMHGFNVKAAQYERKRYTGGRA